MPFHVSGHKARTVERSVSGIKQRLGLVAWGAVFLAFGLLRFSQGVLFIVNWQAMPIYSGALISTGAVLIVLALIPFSWVETVAHWFNSDRRK
jgi:hypothetical protein